MADWLGRVPFVSLIATILCCLGVGIFCVTLFIAVDITLSGIFEKLFSFTVPWLKSLQIFFIIVAVVMGAYSIMLLTFGFLATGATRQNLYSGAKCIMGGRVSAAFFIVVSYALNLLWILVTTVLALPIVVCLMLLSVCEWEIEDRPVAYYENYCLNLSRFGIYRNYTENYDKNALCDETDLSEFCKHVRDASPMYASAFVGSLLIVLGMIMFLMILANNYQRIKMSKELSEYRDAVDIELRDSVVTSNSKVSGNY